ncbi:hypothetical protein DAI22_01g032200 [Oryza sativa Japonica Group]|nr:hypothetical protein DAI22_01g032200 [Oryza sativa Japonica Group]
MAIPPALARRESEHDGAASSNIPAVLLVLGVATVSVAINNTAAAATNYHCSLAFAISLAGAFLSGMAMIGASVWVSGDPRGRTAAGKKIIYASMAPLVLAAAGLAVVMAHSSAGN